MVSSSSIIDIFAMRKGGGGLSKPIIEASRGACARLRAARRMLSAMLSVVLGILSEI